MSTVTIDLGVIDDSWDHVDDDAVGLPRGWGLAAVLALLLSLVSAAPPPGRPHEVTRQPLRNGEFHVAGGALFVLDSDRTPTPVEVFDADDGSLRWTFTPRDWPPSPPSSSAATWPCSPRTCAAPGSPAPPSR